MKGPFTVDDLDDLAACVARSWRRGIGLDWSVAAGTLEWSCAHTADHAVDCLIAPAFFLASRRTDAYPAAGWHPGSDASPEQLAEGVEMGARLLGGIVSSSPDDARALMIRAYGTIAPPQDFAPRGALELVVHAHDVCAGLGIEFDPPRDACEHLREHVRDWPFFGGYWPALTMRGDPWDDLLTSAGRMG